MHKIKTTMHFDNCTENVMLQQFFKNTFQKQNTTSPWNVHKKVRLRNHLSFDSAQKENGNKLVSFKMLNVK